MPTDTTDKRSIEALCRLIYNKPVIPIIGFDLHNQQPGDDILLEIAKQCYPDRSDEVMRNLKLQTGYEVINAIYQRLDPSDKELFHTDVAYSIKDKYNYLGLRPDALRQLTCIKKFPFYINATFFDSLARAVSIYRVPPPAAAGEKNFDVYNYHPRNPQNIEVELGGPLQSKFRKPTVYNLLGTLDTSHGEYVLTDVDYTELLVKMISNENGRFNGLRTAIEDATLLFIGCDFPDWVLRMFLKFCFRSEKFSQSNLGRNYVIEQLTNDPGKSFFIGSYGIKRFTTPPGQFIKEVYDTLSAQYPDCIEKRYFNHPVFISYNHEDQELVERIQRQLEAHNVLVWKDYNYTRTGDVLDEVVRNAIESACAVIPVITNSVQSASPQKYYPKEWNYVCDKLSTEMIKPLRSKDYFYNTIPGNVFHESTSRLLLVNGNGQQIFETVQSGDNPLSENFVKELKDIQYKATINQFLTHPE